MTQNLSQPPAVNAPESELDLVRYLDVLVANRWLIAGIAAVVMLLGATYAFLARPVYEADVLVQVEDNPNSAKSLLGDVSSLFDVKTDANAEIEILRSRMVVGKAVDNLHLYITAKPHYFPLIGAWVASRAKQLSEPGLFGLGGYTWGTELIDVDGFDVPEALEGQPFKLTALGNGRYRLENKSLDTPIEGVVGEPLEAKQSVGTIQLLVNTLAAKAGAAFELQRDSRLKTLEMLQDKLKISEKGKQSGIIGASLEGKNPALTAAIMNQIATEYVAQNIKRKAEEAERSLVFLDGLLPQLKLQLERAEMKYNEMRNLRGTFDLSEEGKAFLQESVTTETSLQELKQKRAELLTRFTASHPGVQAIDQQIAVMNGKVGAMTRRLKSLPNIEQDTVRLMRDVQVDNDLYVSLLNDMQQLKLVKAGKVGNVRLVDGAAVPEEPVKPKKLTVTALAGVLGVVLGVVAAFVRNTLFGGITDPQDIEEHTGLSVYATVPLSDVQIDLSSQLTTHKRGQYLLARRVPDDPSIESLRSLRTALQFAMQDSGNNLVVLTGPTPGVGKSFVSANLAAVIATGGKRVLLVDADMRKGYLHQYFGKDRKPGLLDLLAGDRSIEQVVHREVVPGLDFIATGLFPHNPSELLLNPRMVELMDTFRAQYDLVLIDTPPVLAVTDTAILAARAGTVLMVTRFERSTLGEIRETIKQLQHANVEVRGVVFNALAPNTYRYGYGSRYGRYRYVQYGYTSKPSAEAEAESA
ncbi:polysaccharide biosynthesis tyrosine autokinase [Ralstonia pseudosolanacearum]|uniref:polysaccharide biosynthesis tyrosine autokinase n=1 Tax=Ralstonia pseudosolanacearum TaxID=1310165 RepID=UPI001FF9CDA9|nr:polysaccharide biosynthesis tyrosine autokinase [Ralstonia pseudosolanacearum]